MKEYEYTMVLWKVERDADGDEINRTKIHEVVPSPNVHECPQDKDKAVLQLEFISQA